MKIPLLLVTLFLTACSTTVPVKNNFPTISPELTTRCSQLKNLKENSKLSEIATTIIDNYTQYHECAAKVDAWNEWYTTQKKIFEEVK